MAMIYVKTLTSHGVLVKNPLLNQNHIHFMFPENQKNICTLIEINLLWTINAKDSFINLLNIYKMRGSQKPIIAEYTAPVQETLCTASSNEVL